MENRRNYYRVLHVQPDAPAAVIKSTYRTLMQKLKMHPDLGGNTWNAALINEAYSVLHDPLKREQYDRQVLNRLQNRQTQESAADMAPPEAKRGHCRFCKSICLIVPGRSASESCLESRSPLQGINDDETQIALRRLAARIERTFDITYFTYWPQAARSAVSQVKNQEAPGEASIPVRVGLKFMTVSFNLPRGTFVGMTV